VISSDDGFKQKKVSNRLEQSVVDSKTTQEFQRRLQCCAKIAAKGHALGWQLMYSVVLT